MSVLLVFCVLGVLCGSLPAQERIQCRGVTLHNRQCLRTVADPPGYCHDHIGQAEETASGPMVIDSPTRLVGVKHDDIISLVAGSDGSVLVDVEARGIHISNTSRVGIDGAVIRDPLPHHPTVYPAEHFGVWIRDSQDIVVERVHVHGSIGKGLTAGRSQRITFRDCVVHDTQHWDFPDDPDDWRRGIHGSAGIYLSQTTDSLIDNCTVLDPYSNSLKLSGQADRNIVRNSRFRKARGFDTFTVLIQGGSDNLLFGNLIEGLTERAAIRIEDHPDPDRGGPAERNVIESNRIRSSSTLVKGGWFFNPGPGHPETLERGNVFRDNVETAAE